MSKTKLKITKEMLQEKLHKATECCIQHLGFPCNTCFHALSLHLRYDIHRYWLAVLAFRGDYKELKQKPSLIKELYEALTDATKLCRYCKDMKPFGNEGSSYCPKSKGDNTAKKCKDFKEVN